MKRLNIITKCNPFGLFQLKHYFHDSVEKLEKHSESKCSDPVYSILLESKMKKRVFDTIKFYFKMQSFTSISCNTGFFSCMNNFK